jgi:hypothetical protein
MLDVRDVPGLRFAFLLGVGSFVAAGCSASSSGEGADETGAAGASDALTASAVTYSATSAVAYATSHWDDGVGECAQFTSDSLRAGHLNIGEITWVPDLLAALHAYGFEEHQAGTSAAASRGDVVFFSDAAGSRFCQANDADEDNCGHVCLVTVAGTSDATILVDCHNNAHHEIPVADILGGGYSVYRVYHLHGTGSGGSSGVIPCTTDFDCNQGEHGSDVVCAASEGYCIRGCHSSEDCPDDKTCAPTHPHWSCQ